MTLDDLKKIESDAKSAGHRASTAKSAQGALASLRNGPHVGTFDGLWKALSEWRYGASADGRIVMEQVLTEHAHHLLRIAELRLEATARHESTAAALLKAQLSAFLGEEKSASDTNVLAAKGEQ